MVIAALTASGKSSPDGLGYDVKSKVDELITAVNGLGAIVPGAAVPNVGAIAAHTTPEAIDAVYGDLAAARTSVNALAINVEIALDQTDVKLNTLATKVDALLASLRAAGLVTP
jgi:hypothetical protein